MPSEPHWLTVDEIVGINEVLVRQTGEPHFLRNRAALEGACDRPRNRWHFGEADIVTLAVALLHGIASAHPFEQGNKRTAAIAGLAFIELNGYRWSRGDDELLAELIEALVTHRISEADFAEMIRRFIEPA